MATLALIPGLVSDSIVWAPLADAVAHRNPCTRQTCPAPPRYLTWRKAFSPPQKAI